MNRNEQCRKDDKNLEISMKLLFECLQMEEPFLRILEILFSLLGCYFTGIYCNHHLYGYWTLNKYFSFLLKFGLSIFMYHGRRTSAKKLLSHSFGR